MSRLVPLLCLCAVVLLLHTLPAHAEPTRVPPSPSDTTPTGLELAPRAACPQREDETQGRAHAPIDLNIADESALLELPGIGPARARAILDFRSAHGRFRSLAQLLQIRGIGRALLKQLRPLVTLSS